MSRFEHLPQSLGGVLDDPVEEERVHRIWKGTRARVRGAARRTIAVRTAGATILLASVAVAITLFAAREPRVLHLADGGAPVALSATTEPVRAIMDDRSRVTVAPGARWLPTRNVSARFESEVEHGRATFDVTPGGPRTWIVRAGRTTVEVIGTSFVVERDADRTRVEVSRGAVRVRDERLARGERVLRAGDSVTIGEPAEEPAPSPAREETAREETAPADPEPLAAPIPPERARRRAAPVESAPAWETLAREGDHHGAYEALGAPGLREQTARSDASQLMLLADVARLSGHPDEAVAPLERLIEEHASDSRAPLAAIVLGRIEMDVLHRHDRARRAFERALALGAPAALRADVERRLETLGD